MYHYIKEFDPSLPYFRFLDANSFENQLDYFQEKFGFVTRDEWLNAVNNKKLNSAEGKVLLTFDDGISCHYDYVYKILSKRGLWGIFYVPTQPYQNGKMLDVHRIHLLCGAYSGKELLSALGVVFDEKTLPTQKLKEYLAKTYTRQVNYEGVSEFKRILNYFVSYEIREALIDSVARELNYNFNAAGFYIPMDKLVEMQLGGNIIGSHTVSHFVMSRLSEAQQREEIKQSFNFLESNLQLGVKTYCHPYGGFHTFNNETVSALSENRVLFSFNVESRDISDSDLNSSIQYLPRYDCNQFPFGAAS